MGAEITPEAAGWFVGDGHHLRQVLLNLCAVALRTSASECIEIEVCSSPIDACVTVRWTPSVNHAANMEITKTLDIVGELSSLIGGSLEEVLRVEGELIEINVHVPAVVQLPVLVIDDNPDALQLFRRYLEGTAYRFIGSREPEEALDRLARPPLGRSL